MVRTIKKTPTKALNSLGTAYHASSDYNKALFQTSLIILSQRDGKDYWKAFRSVWRFSPTIGSAPAAIVIAAYHELGLSFDTLAKKMA